MLQPSTILTNLGTLTASVPVVTVINSTYFTVSTQLMLVNGQYLKVQYKAYLGNGTVHPNQTIAVSVATSYTSTPLGFYLPGRYHNSTATGWVTSLASFVTKIPTISTYIYYTDIPETPMTPSVVVNIGELIWYRVLVQFPESTSTASINVTLPTGIIYQAATISYIGSKILNSALAVGQSINSVNSQLVQFYFGTIDLYADNIVDNRSSVIVQVSRTDFFRSFLLLIFARFSPNPQTRPQMLTELSSPRLHLLPPI